MRALLFSRLTPLLLLNALPPAALVAEDRQHQEQQQQQQHQQQRTTREGLGEGEACAEVQVAGCLEDLRGLLLERTERVYEYDQVNHGPSPRIAFSSVGSRGGLGGLFFTGGVTLVEADRVVCVRSDRLT